MLKLCPSRPGRTRVLANRDYARLRRQSCIGTDLVATTSEQPGRFQLKRHCQHGRRAEGINAGGVMQRSGRTAPTISGGPTVTLTQRESA